MAPLLRIVSEQLDRTQNPFFEHAEAQYFLAWRDGRAVGRISAHIDRNLNEFQDNDWGLWGWFECEDDPEARARAARRRRELAARARRGHDDRPDGLHHQRRGGLMIEGFERPPLILYPWHHPYYQALLEQDPGLAKVMDLYMWSLHVSGREKVHPRDLGDGGEGRVRARDRVSQTSARRTSTREVSASSRSTTPRGSATGASCR